MTVVLYDTMLKRIRGEYLEMPGLRLPMAQAQRFCDVERTLCQRVLGTLVEAGFLCVRKDRTFAHLTDGADSPHPRPAKADLEMGVRSEKAS